MSDLWAALDGGRHLGPLAGRLRRVIESQEQVATSALADDLSGQALLEDLIEASKPPLRAGTERLHYLLATPFRYPPLRHGSRFATRHEPSLLYGARGLATALAECAYYRLVFWHGMALPPPAGRLLTQHTTFAARYRCARGVRLQDPPFAAHATTLCDPGDYRATQALGAAMRTAGVEAFEYCSARDPAGGINAALFGPGALAGRRPIDPEPLLCETRAELVRFSGSVLGATREYPLETFLAGGRLPVPAA